MTEEEEANYIKAEMPWIAEGLAQKEIAWYYDFYKKDF